MNVFSTPLFILWPFLAASLLSGCTQAPTEKYFLVNEGTPPEVITTNGEVKLISADSIEDRLEDIFPELESIVINDNQYMTITERWFKEVVSWSDNFIKQQVPELEKLENPPLSYAETFIGLISNVADLAVAKRYNVKGSVLIGLLVAEGDGSRNEAEAEWKKQTYVFGLTDTGGIVYDLKTAEIIPLQDFPNPQSIIAIMF